MSSESSIANRVCRAMREAGIIDASTQPGIDFCTRHCPYELCIVVEFKKPQMRLNMKRSLEMMRLGWSNEKIAAQLKLSIWTIIRYAKNIAHMSEEEVDEILNE